MEVISIDHIAGMSLFFSGIQTTANNFVVLCRFYAEKIMTSTAGIIKTNNLFTLSRTFLANVNSRSRSLYAIARPSVCLSVVCLSVCL